MMSHVDLASRPHPDGHVLPDADEAPTVRVEPWGHENPTILVERDEALVEQTVMHVAEYESVVGIVLLSVIRVRPGKDVARDEELSYRESA